MNKDIKINSFIIKCLLIVFCLLSGGNIKADCLGEYEDLQNDYTEVDPNGRFSLSTASNTITGLTRNEDAYVYKDFGANYFSGDFEHLLEIKVNSGASENGDIWQWTMSNSVDDFKGIKDASGDALSVDSYYAGGNYKILVRELDGGNLYSSAGYTFASNTIYYLKITRDEDVEPFGTLYLRIYSDEDRTNLLNTQTSTLHTSKKDFRYLYAGQSYNDAQALSISGIIRNLDICESVAVGGSTAEMNFPELLIIILAVFMFYLAMDRGGGFISKKIDKFWEYKI